MLRPQIVLATESGQYRTDHWTLLLYAVVPSTANRFAKIRRYPTMIPGYDVFRIDNKGLTWIEPAVTLDDALTRIQQHAAKEPGDYFVYDHSNGERIMLKVQRS